MNRAFLLAMGAVAAILNVCIGARLSATSGDLLCKSKVNHPTRPLIQAGSGNLLPSPGFVEGLKGWDVWGDASVVEMDGEKVLRFGPQKDADAARIRVYIPQPEGGVLYRLRFQTWAIHSVRPDRSNKQSHMTELKEMIR